MKRNTWTMNLIVKQQTLMMKTPMVRLVIQEKELPLIDIIVIAEDFYQNDYPDEESDEEFEERKWSGDERRRWRV